MTNTIISVITIIPPQGGKIRINYEYSVTIKETHIGGYDIIDTNRGNTVGHIPPDFFWSFDYLYVE